LKIYLRGVTVAKGDVHINDVAKAAGVPVGAAKRALGILIGEPANLIVNIPGEVVKNVVIFLRQNVVKGK
jgi:hypothetical protein